MCLLEECALLTARGPIIRYFVEKVFKPTDLVHSKSPTHLTKLCTRTHPSIAGAFPRAKLNNVRYPIE